MNNLNKEYYTKVIYDNKEKNNTWKTEFWLQYNLNNNTK
jgi:hypothetical protein